MRQCVADLGCDKGMFPIRFETSSGERNRLPAIVENGKAVRRFGVSMKIRRLRQGLEASSQVVLSDLRAEDQRCPARRTIPDDQAQLVFQKTRKRAAGFCTYDPPKVRFRRQAVGKG